MANKNHPNKKEKVQITVSGLNMNGLKNTVGSIKGKVMSMLQAKAVK